MEIYWWYETKHVEQETIIAGHPGLICPAFDIGK